MYIKKEKNAFDSTCTYYVIIYKCTQYTFIYVVFKEYTRNF